MVQPGLGVAPDAVLPALLPLHVEHGQYAVILKVPRLTQPSLELSDALEELSEELSELELLLELLEEELPELELLLELLEEELSEFELLLELFFFGTGRTASVIFGRSLSGCCISLCLRNGLCLSLTFCRSLIQIRLDLGLSARGNACEPGHHSLLHNLNEHNLLSHFLYRIFR